MIGSFLSQNYIMWYKEADTVLPTVSHFASVAGEAYGDATYKDA